MNNRKMTVLTLAAVTGLALLAPAQAQAAGTSAKTVAQGTCGWNSAWTLDSEGVLTVSGSYSMNDYKARYADVPWEAYRDEIKSVVIGDEITMIGDYAFYGCENLTEVSVGEKVKVIGNHAFANCVSLEKVDGCEGLENIEGSAFRNDTALTDAEFVEEAETIGTYAFYHCTGLSKITLNDSLTKVSEYLFAGDTSLTTVKMGDKVKTIGSRAFYRCSSLKNVTLPDSLTTIGSSAFMGCASLTSIVVPDSVTSLGSYAFCSCTGLKEAVLGSGITSISSYTFMGCTSLQGVQVTAKLTKIGKNAFTDDSEANFIYEGTESQWASVKVYSGNTGIDEGHLVFLGGAAEKKDISECTGSLEYTRGIYNRKAKQPDVTVTTAAGVTLKKGTDYKVTYENNVNPGAATATVTGIGDYTGTLTLNFSVIPAKGKLAGLTNRLNCIAVSFHKQSEATGYQIRRRTYGSTTWSKAVDIDMDSSFYLDFAAVQNGRTYQYEVRAVFLAEDGTVYYGPYSEHMTIRRLEPPTQDLTALGDGTIEVTWNAYKNASGYEIMLSTSKDFTEETTRTVQVSDGTATSKTVTGLAVGGRYYVKIRVCSKNSLGTEYVSSWSVWRSVVVK